MTDPGAWLAALEERHLANLTRPELTRALRALSSCYVERRDKLTSGAALEGAGKRAAFALFYGPLHFMTVTAVVRAMLAHELPIQTIADLGCGTGVGGAAWAAACAKPPSIAGIDRGHIPPNLALRIVIGMLSIGMVASSNYVLNELLDAPNDRLHPIKCARPVPSGQVSVRWAYVQWLAMMVVGLGGRWGHHPRMLVGTTPAPLRHQALAGEQVIHGAGGGPVDVRMPGLEIVQQLAGPQSGCFRRVVQSRAASSAAMRWGQWWGARLRGPACWGQGL